MKDNLRFPDLDVGAKSSAGFSRVVWVSSERNIPVGVQDQVPNLGAVHEKVPLRDIADPEPILLLERFLEATNVGALANCLSGTESAQENGKGLLQVRMDHQKAVMNEHLAEPAQILVLSA